MTKNPAHDTTCRESTLSCNDRRALWWLLEQNAWNMSDLIRFATYTELLSDLDASVLIQHLNKVENLIKRGREDDAI